MKKRSLVNIAGIALVVLGFYGWLGGFVRYPWFTSSYEIPLGDAEGIAIDSTGNLYCGSQFYHCIVKYDSAGKFISTIWIDCSGGSFCFRITGDKLEVATARGDHNYILSLDGDMLKNDDGGPGYEALANRGSKHCESADGTVYELSSSYWFPVVAKISGTGDRQIVISQTLWQWLTMGPFPAWIIIACGGIIQAVSGRKKIKE